MRQPNRILLIVLVASLGLLGRAYADDRADARAHYQAGVRLFNSADYRGAIGEFTKAQQLAPADLNEYNLGLCYDKLGEAENAIQHYRAYVDRVPNDPRRAEIDASISRLEAAVKSAAAKRADEQKAEEARRAEEARKADEARRAEEAKRAPEVKPAEPPPPPAGGVGGSVGGTAGGSIGTPGTGVVAPPTGDAQLDRVNSIDINQIRQQRVGGGTSGMQDPRMAGQPGQPGVGAVATAGGPTAGAPPYQGTNGQPPPPNPGDQPQPKKETPIYKKWWFWVVIAVSAVVVYEIATTSSAPTATGLALPPHHNAPSASPGGITILRF